MAIPKYVQDTQQTSQSEVVLGGNRIHVANWKRSR